MTNKRNHKCITDVGFLKDEDEDDRVNTQKDLCRSLTSELSKHHLKKKKRKRKIALWQKLKKKGKLKSH